ncbi:alpha/beta hydrolase family protein [Pseudoxanthomonas suwonensis]|nr:prolyl oligopeptidase family serine peptidase [Pseudoxanthomonas suwonensis]
MKIAFRAGLSWRDGRKISSALMIASVFISGGFSVADAVNKQSLTVRDSIVTTRFMVADRNGTSVAVSPDGSRYVAMLIRGDIERDGVEVEVVTGELASLDVATPQPVVSLFTRGLGRAASALLMPTVNFPAWVDNERIAFLWEDERGIRQVVMVNVKTKQWNYLTNSRTDVTNFAIGGHNTVVYEARREYSPEISMQRWRNGFSVDNTDAYSLVTGVVDGSTIQDIVWGLGERFVQTGMPPDARVNKLQVKNGGVNTYNLHWPTIKPVVSPDGRMAIVSGTPQQIPDSWRRYNLGLLGEIAPDWETRRHTGARQLQQMYVVSVDRASAWPLFDAPLNPANTMQSTLKWAPEGRSILVWAVYLPADSQDAEGLAGDAIAEVDVVTGRYKKLPLSAEATKQIEDAYWTGSDAVEIHVAGERLSFRKRSGDWKLVEAVSQREPTPTISIEVRQDVNTPPALYAVEDATGRAKMVFEPNPGLTARFSLGKVEIIDWRDEDDQTWQGRLFYPIGYQRSQRYPLVIQTQGWTRPEDFTLYGRGTLGPGASVHLGQPLANRGIAVLVLGPSPPASGPEATVRMRGFKSAINHLDAQGMVDRSRIGIMGHSRGGWHVAYALAFSDFPFAAAIDDDAIDSGYVEATMLSWADTERRNGADPFGVGMKDWLERAPAFNVEHIRTPLLMTVTDSFAGKAAPVVMHWEMFSRLRHLRKPVELYVIPNIERGSHVLQNPSQVLAHQERAMDWWRYWLLDERDSSEEKREQYADWDKLRELRDQDAKQPKPPRLRWTVEPVASEAGP